MIRNQTIFKMQANAITIEKKTTITYDHSLFKHNVSNILSMLSDIEKITKTDCSTIDQHTTDTVNELAINIKKHFITMLKQCAVTGRCPVVHSMASDSSICPHP